MQSGMMQPDSLSCCVLSSSPCCRVPDPSSGAYTCSTVCSCAQAASLPLCVLHSTGWQAWSDNLPCCVLNHGTGSSAVPTSEAHACGFAALDSLRFLAVSGRHPIQLPLWLKWWQGRKTPGEALKASNDSFVRAVLAAITGPSSQLL